MSSVSGMGMPTAPERSRPRWRIRAFLLPTLVTTALVVPNLTVIALGVEDFPFTTAPMFAQYVGPDTTLYAFRMEGVRDGVAEPLPIEQTNLDAREVQRQLASWFYRPLTATSPFRDVTGNAPTPAAFEERMSEFFQPIADFLRDRRSIAYDDVELYVDAVDSTGRPLDTTHVGEYDTATHRYTRLVGGER